MSYYHKQKFVSPNRLFAEVKEELRSYFTANVVDDLMFPIWTERCLAKLRKSAFQIKETVLDICDYSSCLPDDFESLREAWACATSYSEPIQNPSSCYYQTDCRLTTTDNDRCNPCDETEECNIDYMVVHKVTGHTILKFQKSFLLRPGNLNAENYCKDYRYGTVEGNNKFDINNNKISVTFQEGTIYLIYYANSIDGEQMIPDNQWVMDYIRNYLKYMIYLQIFNQTTDETFNQVRYKVELSKQEYLDAKIMAETELKRQTPEKVIQSIKRDKRRFRKYKL